MLVSILHRITGGALATVGLAVLVWWLAAAAGNASGYQDFSAVASSLPGMIVLIGLTWAFFQKTFAGLRHLVMDTGMGFELDANKKGAILTIVASVVCTIAVWAYVLGARQ